MKAKRNTDSNNAIGIAAEDKYALVDMSSPAQPFPHSFTLANLSHAMKECRSKWDFLWDFRRSGEMIFEDIKDAYEEMIWLDKPTLIASQTNQELVASLAGKSSARILTMREKYLPIHTLDLTAFNEDYELMTDWEELVDGRFGDIQNPEVFQHLGFVSEDSEYDDYIGGIIADLGDPAGYLIADREDRVYFDILQEERAKMLVRFLGSIAGNSLLTELALIGNESQITVVPYHSHSLHYVPKRHSDDVVLLQPGKVSHTYWNTFAKDIQELEQIINANKVRESAVEQLLRKNPLFLRGLNYRQAYFQVILPEAVGSGLRPDIVAKPVGSDWWDIIDIKLPNVPILVGRDNRVSLSSALTEAVSQLREYSMYFDQRRFAKYVEEKYGFKCHKPKLVVIIGRDPFQYSADEQRRALTSYPSLEIVTYDRLLRSAKDVLLL